MTGWRIGYAAGNSDVISAMSNLSGQSTSNPTSISQKAAQEAFSGDQNEVVKMINEFELRRNYICNELNKIYGIKCSIPNGAFYVFPDISSFFGKRYKDIEINNSVDFTNFLLNEARVAVVPGIEFGLDKNIRISYATSIVDIREGVKRIRDVINKYW